MTGPNRWETIYVRSLTVVGLVCAVAVVITSVRFLLAPAPGGSAAAKLQGVTQSTLLGVVLLVGSFQTFLRARKGAETPSAATRSTCAAAMFSLFAGLFSLAAGLLISAIGYGAL